MEREKGEGIDMSRISVSVSVDVSEFWDALENEELEAEMKERGIYPEPEEPIGDKVDTLDLLRAVTDLCRKNDRLDLAIRVDTLIEELWLV